jgi:hypothetical protein
MHEDDCGENHGHGECYCHEGHHRHGSFARRFMTKTEKIEKLEHYAQDLTNELAAVQEHIKELKGE